MGWLVRTLIVVALWFIGLLVMGLFGVHPSLAEVIWIAALSGAAIGIDEGLK